MSVDRRNCWPWIGEDVQVRRSIGVKPSIDLGKRAAGEEWKVVIKVEARREHPPGACQDDRTVPELTLQPIKRTMEVGKEGGVLSMCFIRGHRHQAGMLLSSLDLPSHSCPAVRSRFVAAACSQMTREASQPAGRTRRAHRSDAVHRMNELAHRDISLRCRTWSLSGLSVSRTNGA